MSAILPVLLGIIGGFGMGWGIHGIILTRKHIKDLEKFERDLENIRRVL